MRLAFSMLPGLSEGWTPTRSRAAGSGLRCRPRGLGREAGWREQPGLPHFTFNVAIAPLGGGLAMPCASLHLPTCPPSLDLPSVFLWSLCAHTSLGLGALPSWWALGGCVGLPSRRSAWEERRPWRMGGGCGVKRQAPVGALAPAADSARGVHHRLLPWSPACLLCRSSAWDRAAVVLKTCLIHREGCAFGVGP